LTLRKCEVMTLVMAGRLNKQIVAELGLSEATVKDHCGPRDAKRCLPGP
jgi:DNA-binding NarL/FixJ family response regulator